MYGPPESGKSTMIATVVTILNYRPNRVTGKRRKRQ